jgi:hypothetical protein
MVRPGNHFINSFATAAKAGSVTGSLAAALSSWARVIPLGI